EGFGHCTTSRAACEVGCELRVAAAAGHRQLIEGVVAGHVSSSSGEIGAACGVWADSSRLNCSDKAVSPLRTRAFAPLTLEFIAAAISSNDSSAKNRNRKASA